MNMYTMSGRMGLWACYAQNYVVKLDIVKETILGVWNVKKNYFLLSVFLSRYFMYFQYQPSNQGRVSNYSNIALINPTFKFLIFDLNFKSTK